MAKSKPSYCFVVRITLPLAVHHLQRITLQARVRGKLTPLLYDNSNDKLYLPVVPGERFSLEVTNQTPVVGCIPVRICEGDRWINIFRGGETDPALMSDHEMWLVAQENNLRPGRLFVDCFVQPNGLEPFVASPSSDHDLCVEVYYRPPIRPTILQPLDAPAVRSDADIVTYDPDLPPGSLTVLDVNCGVPTLMAKIRLISRRDAALMAAAVGIRLDPELDRDWSEVLYYPNGKHHELVFDDLIRRAV